MCLNRDILNALIFKKLNKHHFKRFLYVFSKNFIQKKFTLICGLNTVLLIKVEGVTSFVTTVRKV
jgi:hypothetical protein